VDAFPSRGVEVGVRRKVSNVDSESGISSLVLDLRWNESLLWIVCVGGFWRLSIHITFVGSFCISKVVFN